MRFHTIRIDLERRLVWISGDTGVSFVDPAGTVSYAPYDFRGNALGPDALPGLHDRERWFHYEPEGATSPWFLRTADPAALGIGCGGVLEQLEEELLANNRGIDDSERKS